MAKVNFNTVVALLRADFARYRPDTASTAGRLIATAARHPGFRAVALYRFQDYLYRGRSRALAVLVHSMNVTLNGADIVLGAEIGPGLLINHPVGVVVGTGVIVGARCTLLQNTTLGERNPGREAQPYPRLGDDVVVGAGAKLLGGIRVGDSVTIGANSVVLCDLPDSCTAVGVPARVL